MHRPATAGTRHDRAMATSGSDLAVACPGSDELADGFRVASPATIVAGCVAPGPRHATTL
jgi:hypothetical protein